MNYRKGIEYIKLFRNRISMKKVTYIFITDTSNIVYYKSVAQIVDLKDNIYTI